MTGMLKLFGKLLAPRPDVDDITRHRAAAAVLRESLFAHIQEDVLSGRIPRFLPFEFDSVQPSVSYHGDFITSECDGDTRIVITVRDQDKALGAVMANLTRETIIHTLPDDARNTAGMARLMDALLEIDVYYESVRRRPKPGAR
jgi:hypothetical protein